MAKQQQGDSFAKRLKAAWKRAQTGELVKEVLGAETKAKKKSK